MIIKKIITKLSEVFKGKRSRFFEMTLCGVKLKILKGTLRQKIDQDDTWWYYLSKHHDVIYDIGCNVGYTATLALIQNPNRKMILVDPNPKALHQAATNLIENGLGSRVQFTTSFVGDTVDSVIKFYTIGAGAAGSMHKSHAESAASIDSYLEVKTVTLDYLYDFYNLKPDLVKIDVEGAETLVMKAAKQMAKNSGCSFFIEMHNVEHLGMEAAAQIMLDWCKEMNYNAWYPQLGELLNSAESIKNRGKCHLLLLPKEKQYPIYLQGIKPYAALPTKI